MRPDEIVIAAEQLNVIFETFLPAGLTDRSPPQIGRALSDREIQPLNERGVQFHGVLRVPQSLLQPPGSDHSSSLHSDHPIVPAGLDHLTIKTGRSKHS